MATPIVLETPSSPDEIYLARGAEVEPLRPAITGDVYRDPEGSIFMLVQHPCAMRKGAELLESILAVRVVEVNGLRTKWKDESPKLMPLPQLLQTDQAHAGQFVEFLVTTPADLDSSTRVASLSPLGVNLLLQRWVYHNSRVVIPIQTYAEQTIGPYDEADLAEEWITERVPVLTPQDAYAEFDAWLRQPANGGDTTRQARLNQRQSASMVRKEASARLKALTEQTPE